MKIIEAIKQAGVVGCGGAGFPTHAKLNRHVEHFIVNGVECEPLLRTDRYIMTNKAPQIVAAADAVRRELRAAKCTIALKSSYTEEIAALRKAIADKNLKIDIHETEVFFPAGDEHVLVFEITGRVVPPGEIPFSVGAVVGNVATMLAVYDAQNRIPFTMKYLTVTGEVKNPSILHVPVGTSFNECIAQAGGALTERYFVVDGGPMMGEPMNMEDANKVVVTKTTSGIIVLKENSSIAIHSLVDIKRNITRARSACIQCIYCTLLCPRYLLGHPLRPHLIMRKIGAAGELSKVMDDPDIRAAQLCCECGICEVYACPMGLQPRRINVYIKDKLSKAGIRYTGSGEESVPLMYREERKTPTNKIAARAGVIKYYDYSIKKLTKYIPQRVSIPLKMHVGVPATPIVKKGEMVKLGQLIAECTGDKLGAAVHASIEGQIESIGDEIVIVKK